VEIFGLVVYYIYREVIEVIPFTEGDSKATPNERAANDKPSWHSLVSLWLLADYLQIPALQNLTIQTLYEKQTRLGKIPVHTFRELYENTASGSMLRKYFAETCVWRPFAESSIYQSLDIPEAMLRDIAAGFNDRYRNAIPTSSSYYNSKNYFVKTTDEESVQLLKD